MKNLIIKIIRQVVALLFYSFGVSLIVFSTLGASPIDAATYYANELIPVFNNLIPNFTGQGIWLIIFNMIIAIGLYIVCKKRNIWINVLISVFIGLLFNLGWFTYSKLFGDINGYKVGVKIIMAFIGINLMAFGIAYLAAHKLYATPFDELAIKLEETTKRYFLSKIILDGSFLIIAFVLGLIYGNVFEQIGIFTIVVLAFLGPFINLYINIIDKFKNKKGQEKNEIKQVY